MDMGASISRAVPSLPSNSHLFHELSQVPGSGMPSRTFSLSPKKTGKGGINSLFHGLFEEIQFGVSVSV